MISFIVSSLALCLLAMLAVTLPLWRGGQRATLALLLIAVPGLGLGVYFLTSNFDFEKPTTQPTIDEMISRLDQRLKDNPDDLEGWRLLGRSKMQMERVAEAVLAYEKAYALSDKSDPMIILDYGEALVAKDQTELSGQAGQLFENALKLAPAHPRALWYGGLVAAARDERSLAADRWEAMLSPDMPADVRHILEARIAGMRGEPVPTAPVTPAAEATRIVAAVRIADALKDKVANGATLFLIANAPGGGPPLAVVRHPAATIPEQIAIGDENAMIAGRNLSSQKTLRLTARVSQTGEPMARPGDIFGEVELQLPVANPISLTIDQLVSN